MTSTSQLALALLATPSEPQLNPGSMACDAELKQALGRIIAQCGLSRAEIAHKLSVVMDRNITVQSLYAITAAGSNNKVPADMCPAIKVVCGSSELLDIQASYAGLSLVDPDDTIKTNLGRVTQAIQELTQLQEQLHQELDSREKADIHLICTKHQ
ncbi:MAG: hypothetical protein HQL50_03765 [Magnetococcales bacterium]|nr:hypothetical protein [Magnetococcales bacterium]